MWQMTEEAERYLKDRGFEVIEGKPSAGEKYPYLTLRKPQQFMTEHEITYHMGPGHTNFTPGIMHPSVCEESILIRQIEMDVSVNREGDGRVFSTTPGKPIKIFVMDSEWMPVATKLREKYTTA